MAWLKCTLCYRNRLKFSSRVLWYTFISERERAREGEGEKEMVVPTFKCKLWLLYICPVSRAQGCFSKHWVTSPRWRVTLWASNRVFVCPPAMIVSYCVSIDSSHCEKRKTFKSYSNVWRLSRSCPILFYGVSLNRDYIFENWIEFPGI